MNKKNHEVNEILVDENEAVVVRLIYEKYVNEGFGAQRLNRFLYKQGFRNRKGVNFTNTTIIKMLKNIMYVGILRSGETQSEIFPELQIITPDMYESTQKIMEARTQKHSDVPFNSKGKALFSGMVYCAHCGSKLVLTTSSGKRYGGDGRRELKIRYGCHNKVRHPQDCDGQSGYSAEKLDGLVEKLVLQIFRRIKSIPESKLMAGQMERRTAEAASTLANLNSLHTAKSKELESYKSEVYKVIQGTSSWSGELLNELIAETKVSIEKLEGEISEAQAELDDCKRMVDNIRSEYNRILTWSDMYEGSSIEAKKMIMRQIIKKVHIGRHYEVKLELSISFAEYQRLYLEEKTA